MSLLLGNLRDLIGDLWDGTDDPDPEPTDEDD
ncbi:hypothetical protein BJ983_000332 [Actinomycetospora corticicola]|uniref:Uncharacterized protein n=1 Tax=Actinomycetospora corticicola TaxID=663602 RepID=A0A7Y9DRS6_9PSEU|nr:hypothetical protein [Actinomycetospora corticicola]